MMNCFSAGVGVPRRMAALHPSVIEMLGGIEFRLRQGFACGKTLILSGLGGKEQGGHAGGVVVGTAGGRDAVMVGREDQNIRVCPARAFHRDHIGPGAALPAGIGLEGDHIAHLREVLLQILDGGVLSLAADGSGRSGQRSRTSVFTSSTMEATESLETNSRVSPLRPTRQELLSY